MGHSNSVFQMAALSQWRGHLCYVYHQESYQAEASSVELLSEVSIFPKSSRSCVSPYLIAIIQKFIICQQHQQMMMLVLLLMSLFLLVYMLLSCSFWMLPFSFSAWAWTFSSCKSQPSSPIFSASLIFSSCHVYHHLGDNSMTNRMKLIWTSHSFESGEKMTWWSSSKRLSSFLALTCIGTLSLSVSKPPLISQFAIITSVEQVRFLSTTIKRQTSPYHDQKSS